MNSNKFERKGCAKRRCLWKIPFVIAAVVLIKSVLVMVLWNALIPELFQGPLLNYGQALGLTILAKLLVGMGGPPRHFFGGGRFGGHHGFRNRWAHLSPEEREKLREELKNRFNKD